MKESTEDTVEGRRWEVTFLKRKYRYESAFTDSLPTEQRTDDVDDDDIVACLPILLCTEEYTNLRSTSRSTELNSAYTDLLNLIE